MKAEVGKWGNSLALRIPRALAKNAHLAEGSTVEMAVSSGSLVVTPVEREYRLDDLLAGVTENNVHGEVDFGRPVGKELL